MLALSASAKDANLPAGSPVRDKIMVALQTEPDFAHFTIAMVADKFCVELKSLKLYFWSYRNEGAFHEKVTNDVLSDIVRAIDPRFIRVTAKWYVRGGIYTTVVAEHRQKRWKAPARIALPTGGARN